MSNLPCEAMVHSPQVQVDDHANNKNPVPATLAVDETRLSAPPQVGDASPPARLSLPSQPNSASSPVAPGQIERHCLVFRSLPLRTTIRDIMNRLGTPADQGGCGVFILSSTALPPFDPVSKSFVIQFRSVHKAQIANVGWDGLFKNSFITPASQSLLSTITLTPYQPDHRATFVKQLNENAAEPTSLPALYIQGRSLDESVCGAMIRGATFSTFSFYR
jgi:hypothetical protein